MLQGNGAETPPEGDHMLWTVLAVILVLWLLGVVGNVGGGLVHLLLLVAGVVLVAQFLTGRRTVA